MEISTSLPTPVATLIENLPAEIIERILLEVLTHVAPSIDGDTSRYINGVKLSDDDHSSPVSNPYTIYSSSGYSSDGEDDSDYSSYEINQDRVHAPLDFRLTCRTFRNLSWRAFAARLGNTRFDLRSRQSFSNLMAISSNKHLAPWITKLTIVCHGTQESYPYAHCEASLSETVKRMDKGLFHELLRVKRDEESWYPGIWERWPDGSLNGTPSRDVPLERHQQIDVRLLEKILASALQSFSNLNHLCYGYEPEFRPGRYHKCRQPRGAFDDYQSTLDFSFASGQYSGYIAHVGLDILFRALASSGTAVRTMDLAVDLAEHHAFITHVPADIFAKASQKVETLILRDFYCPFFDEDEGIKESRILITKSIFPSLQHLVIDHNDTVAEFDHLVTPWPSPSDIPSLTSLRIKSSYADRASLHSFIQLYGSHAQQIMFVDMVRPDFKALLKIICTLDLEELHIHHEPKHFHPDSRLDKIDQGIPHNIRNAAKTVIISPSCLKDKLESQWAQEQQLAFINSKERAKKNDKTR